MSAKVLFCKHCLIKLHPLYGNTAIFENYLVCKKCKDIKGIEVVDDFVVNDFLEENKNNEHT